MSDPGTKTTTPQNYYKTKLKSNLEYRISRNYPTLLFVLFCICIYLLQNEIINLPIETHIYMVKLLQPNMHHVYVPTCSSYLLSYFIHLLYITHLYRLHKPLMHPTNLCIPFIWVSLMNLARVGANQSTTFHKSCNQICFALTKRVIILLIFTFGNNLACRTCCLTHQNICKYGEEKQDLLT